jgi:hypothetical protein
LKQATHQDGQIEMNKIDIPHWATPVEVAAMLNNGTLP